MARTIQQIKQEIAQNFMADTTLAQKYGFTPGADFDNTFSKVSIENLIIYIIAAAIYTHERIFDQHTQEVEQTIEQLRPHTALWYTSKAKQFLYGEPLIDGTDQYDTTNLTEQQVQEKQIINFAAATENNATLYLKVAKKGPQPLDSDEITAFKQYMHEIKDAGVRLEIISQQGDYLKLNMIIYYNPLLINQQGQSKQTGEKIIEQTIKNYIENIPFNGEFRKNQLVDQLQQVPGVEMVELSAAYHSETGQEGTYKEILPAVKPMSGYFNFNHADITGITYQTYDN